MEWLALCGGLLDGSGGGGGLLLLFRFVFDGFVWRFRFTGNKNKEYITYSFNIYITIITNKDKIK